MAIMARHCHTVIQPVPTNSHSLASTVLLLSFTDLYLSYQHFLQRILRTLVLILTTIFWTLRFRLTMTSLLLQKEG